MGPPPGAPFCQEVPGKFPPRQGILWVCDRGKEGDSVDWKKRRRILWGAWALALGLAVSAWFVSLPDVPALPAGPAALPPKGYLALTFDDGPWPKTTEALLDGLAQRGVKATFFLVGEQVADHQDTVRRMADEGHQIGLHTWHHVSLQGMTREEIAAQLGKTQQTIQAVVGPEELMLRPPYGFVDETLKQWAKTPIVCWSVDTEDWKYRDADHVKKVIVEQAQDGDVVLMHDLYETSVRGALAAIDELQSRTDKTYAFVTVSQLAAIHGITLEPGVVYNGLTDEVAQQIADGSYSPTEFT